MKNKRGFTIVEVLITTTIIFIVMAISIALTFEQIQKARNIAALSTLSSISSMYRTAAALAQSNMPSQNKIKINEGLVVLPAAKTSSDYEKYLDEYMKESFSDLNGMKYTLVDEDGIESAGTVIITYWPNPEKYEHFVWRDGDVTRYYMNGKSEKV